MRKNPEHKEKRTDGRSEGRGSLARRPVVGILIILAGLLLLTALIGMNPETSLLFSSDNPEPQPHPLGGMFQEAASFVLYFTGAGGYYLGFVLLYAGFLFLRPMAGGKRFGLLVSGLLSVIPLLIISDLPARELHKGGGLWGNYLNRLLADGTPDFKIYAAAGAVLAGLLAIMFGFFLRKLLNKRKPVTKRRAAGRAASPESGDPDRPWGNGEPRGQDGPWVHEVPAFSEEPAFHHDPADHDPVERARRSKRKVSLQRIMSLFFGSKEQDPRLGTEKTGDREKEGQGPALRPRGERSRRKPPLVRKVVMDQYGNPVSGSSPPNGAAVESGNPGMGEGKKRKRNTGKAARAGKDARTGKEQPKPAPDQVQRAGHAKGQANRSRPFRKSALSVSAPVNRRDLERETVRKSQELERTLKDFGIEGKVTGVTRGPVITRYELQPAPGVKLNRIVNLSNNIALSLSASGVRIEAPIPGRSAVGIEIPNEEREMVTLGDIIDRVRDDAELPLILGKDLAGSVVVSDLTQMPHLLIAGATGSGKSVCVNSLIMSLLYHKSHEEVRFIMIDPKMVELKIYNGIPHLLTEVITDPRDAGRALRWVLHEMENRYRMLDENAVRNIKGYNRKRHQKLPYIVVIVDEFANLMAISQKDVEDAVVRLAAMSRAVGIHLIMATQRPSVDVITGLIKANFPFRIAFQVASKTDSRTILDTIGAEKLLGKGDMLYAPAGSMNIQRIQGAYISEDEVITVVNEMSTLHTDYLDIFQIEQESSIDEDYDDMMFEQAVDIVLKTKRASASFLQRRLKIGYNRAARLIELMEEKGIIGPPRGSKPREIYIDQMS